MYSLCVGLSDGLKNNDILMFQQLSSLKLLSLNWCNEHSLYYEYWDFGDLLFWDLITSYDIKDYHRMNSVQKMIFKQQFNSVILQFMEHCCGMVWEFDFEIKPFEYKFNGMNRNSGNEIVKVCIVCYRIKSDLIVLDYVCCTEECCLRIYDIVMAAIFYYD